MLYILFYRPVNLLTFTRDRAINVVLFGALSGELYTTVFASQFSFEHLTTDPYLKILLSTGIL